MYWTALGAPGGIRKTEARSSRGEKAGRGTKAATRREIYANAWCGKAVRRFELLLALSGAMCLHRCLQLLGGAFEDASDCRREILVAMIAPY